MNATLCFTILCLCSAAPQAEPKVTLDDVVVYPLMFFIGASGKDSAGQANEEDGELRIYRDGFAYYPEHPATDELHQAKAASAWLLGRKLFVRPKVDIPLRLDGFQSSEVYDPCRDAKPYSFVRNDPLTLRCYGADNASYLTVTPEEDTNYADWFLDLVPADSEPQPE